MNVLLIHGLGRSPASLISLEWRLRQLGWGVEHFGYVAFAEPYTHIVERLQDHLSRLASRGSYSIVAHSLGGLLTRSALNRASIPAPQHIVMLGTPNQLPRLATLAWRLPPFQWFARECGANLASPDFFAALAHPTAPYTIIAGTSGPCGSWSPFGFEVNDGIVSLSETQLTTSDRIIQLPVNHTFMMNDSKVHEIIAQALRPASLISSVKG